MSISSLLLGWYLLRRGTLFDPEGSGEATAPRLKRAARI